MPLSVSGPKSLESDQSKWRTENEEFVYVTVGARAAVLFRQQSCPGLFWGDFRPVVSGRRRLRRFDDSTGYRLTVGYNVNPNVAVEGSYTDAGEFDADDDVLALLSFVGGIPVEDASIEVDGIEFAVVGKAPLSDTVSAYAKLGIFMWDADFNFDFGALGSGSDSDDGSDPFYGAGVSFGIGEKVALNLEYMFYEAADGDVDVLGAGVVVNF